MKALLAQPYVEPKPATPSWTVGSWLAYWLEQMYRPTVEVRTYEATESYVRLHLLPELGPLALADLSGLHVQRLIAQRREEHYAATTIKLIIDKLNQALGAAVALGILDRNPAKGVKRPRIERKERTILSEEQARHLVQVAQEQGRLPVIVAVYTGIRAGELYALHWNDVDFEAGTLRIDSSMAQTKAGKVEKATKTKESRRTIALDPATLLLLAAHKEAQEQDRHAPGWNPGNYLFVNTKGEPFTSNSTWYYWKRLLKAAGLPNMRFHDVRHSFASFLAHLLVPEGATQALMGHAPGSPMLRQVYTHPLPGVGQEAMRKLSDLLKTPGKEHSVVKSVVQTSDTKEKEAGKQT